MGTAARALPVLGSHKASPRGSWKDPTVGSGFLWIWGLGGSSEKQEFGKSPVSRRACKVSHCPWALLSFDQEGPEGWPGTRNKTTDHWNFPLERDISLWKSTFRSSCMSEKLTHNTSKDDGLSPQGHQICPLFQAFALCSKDLAVLDVKQGSVMSKTAQGGKERSQF